MTADTIQKIADDLEGFILLSDQQRKTLVDRLRALSARASAGEGGEDYRTHHNDFRVACLVAQTHATSDADRRYWQHQVNVLDRIKAAAPQPAQAGASGGGEVEIAEIMRGCLSAIEGGRDPRYGFSIGPSIEGIEEAAKRIAAMLATPASPATGDIEPDAIVSTDREGDMFIDVRSVTLKHGDRLYRHPPTPQPAAEEAPARVVAWRAVWDNGDKTEWHDGVPNSLSLGLANKEFKGRVTIERAYSRPPAHGDGEGGCTCPSGDGSLRWPCPKHPPSLDTNVAAVHRKLDERSAKGVREYGVTTDGAGLSRLDWLLHLQEELIDGAVYVQAALTTRPTPEARDAARYRWLRDPENAIVYAKDLANWNGVPYSKPYGHFSYATPEQLDAAIDAALALPAQGEGSHETR